LDVCDSDALTGDDGSVCNNAATEYRTHCSLHFEMIAKFAASLASFAAPFLVRVVFVRPPRRNTSAVH